VNQFTSDGQVGWKGVGPVFGGTYQWSPQGSLEVALDNGDPFFAGIQIERNQELTWNGSDGITGRF
jgi:hypothetical protein